MNYVSPGFEQTLNPVEMALPAQEHLITPATMLSLSRPMAAVKLARMLADGERGTIPWMFYVGISDAEGNIARLVDKLWPESGYGCTEFGAKADFMADSAAFGIISIGALRSPLVSGRAKTAVGLVVASEARKAVWAASSMRQVSKETGENLDLKVGKLGKLSTTSKFMALSCAILTHEMDPGSGRDRASNYALGFASGAFTLNEANLRGYRRIVQDILSK